ncbi:MAG: class I SAM-dependent methyltransferase [Bacteroidales bacterium]|nr:class I SAM-dependent methyltransferase [Bacteroidales bacterium]
MSTKEFLLKVYTFPILSKDKENKYQKIARDTEWDAIKAFIPTNSMFIDIGCGAGYFMEKAQTELQCQVSGIDPDPGAHGVNRKSDTFKLDSSIKKGYAEELDFPEASFDVVFSSHVLEHVNSIEKSLFQMQKVLKPNGVAIIGVPTGTMAIISLFTQLIFTSHIRFINFFFKRIINTAKCNFCQMFFGYSHSFMSKTTLVDISNYRTKIWKAQVSKFFIIDSFIYPALYPFPNFIQLFKLRRFKKIGSSVYFICRKK